MKTFNQNQNKSTATTSPSKKSLFSFVEEKNEEKSKSVQADVIIRKQQFLKRKNSTENTEPLLF